MTGLSTSASGALAVSSATDPAELRSRVACAAATILRVPPSAISDTTLLTGVTIDDLEVAMGTPMQLQFDMKGLTIAEIVDQYVSGASR